jgi:hypothetical protein
MKKQLGALVLGVAAVSSALAQTYEMRIPQLGLRASAAAPAPAPAEPAPPSPLTVIAVSPNSGPLGAATVFTVTGTQFSADTVVRVGQAVASCGVPSASQIADCVAPAQAEAGTYPVTVSKPGSEDASQSFTYTPVGPSGVLVQIYGAGVAGMALNSQDELVYASGGVVRRMNATGAVLGTVFTGTSASAYTYASGCESTSLPAISALAVDQAANTVYLGGSCYSSSTGTRSAALWKVASGTRANALGPAYHTSAGNRVLSLGLGGGNLYAHFLESYNIGSNLAQISLYGSKTNLPALTTTSSIAYRSQDGKPYLFGAYNVLGRHDGGSAWTGIGPGIPQASANAGYAATDSAGYVYFMPQLTRALYKVDPVTGATLKSWPLSGLTGWVTGLAISRTGTPFISSDSGMWRMD